MGWGLSHMFESITLKKRKERKSDLRKQTGNKFTILKISKYRENTNIYFPFPIQTWPLVNQIVDVGKHLFIKMFQLISGREIIELEYPPAHNKSMDLGIEYQFQLTSWKERTEHRSVCPLLKGHTMTYNLAKKDWTWVYYTWIHVSIFRGKRNVLNCTMSMQTAKYRLWITLSKTKFFN